MTEAHRTIDQCNVPPVDDPLGDVDEAEVLAETIVGLQTQLNDLSIRHGQLSIEHERLRAALSSLRNEVGGILGTVEYELRAAAGNTNVALLQLRYDEANAALRGADETSGGT